MAMMAPALPLLLCATLSITAGAAASEVGALLALKRALTLTVPLPPAAAAAFFATSTWDSAAASPCSFAGVTCDPVGGVVTAVSVDSLGVSATSVPFDDLCGGLPALATLSLPENALAGGIGAVTACAGLRDLTLAFNSFCGAVPNLSPLTKLRTLNISSNSFAGAFPWASLAAMPDLAVLALGDNPFLARTDSFPKEVTKIPPGMCKHTSMVSLLMLENNFSGEIPATYTSCDCETLLWFRVNKNSLSGDVPEGLWALPNVIVFDLADNHFTGGIGSGVGNASSLTYLLLAGNRFSGAIPWSIGNASSLTNLPVSLCASHHFR